jgi:DNA-binding NarL/FixJ family response regulator
MKTCLLVEDLPESQRWLTRALEASFPGVAITATASLAEAREQLQARPAPALALVDLGLPDGSGIELIAELARRAPGTVCVVASIYDDDRHLFPALRAGAQGYLLKDQPWEQIAELLRGIVEGRPPLSPAIARRLLGYFRPAPDPELEGLTAREREVLSLIGRGITQAETARLLGISAHTVCGYVKDIYRKLSVSSRAEAALVAQRIGLID